MKYLLAIIVSVLLAACGGKPTVEGTYLDQQGKEAFTFTADGIVHLKDGEAKYTIEGDNISFPMGIMSFEGKITQNGSITWGVNRFTKK